MLLIYAGSGAVMAVLYTVAISVFPSFVNLPWLFRHGLMMMLVAMLSGGVFYILADSVLLGNRTQAKRITGVNRARRKMLTSSAVFMGGLGFVGGITGPIRIIKNTNKFVDFDLSPLNEHDYVIVEINKRPVYIIKRTKLEIEELQKENPQLVDPHSFYSKQPANTRNNYRSIKPEYLVVSAICTHLGCSIKHVPQTGSETDTNQNEMADLPYFLLCPCHEGKFDMAGRVYKNTPPPTNLSIPDHEFISDHVVRIYYPDLKEMWFG
jgi:ubiquinol-cytochrome c reductase iron-sulfur subunit